MIAVADEPHFPAPKAVGLMKSHGSALRPLLMLVLSGLVIGGPPPQALASETGNTAEADPIAAVTKAGPKASKALAVKSSGLEASSEVPWNPPGPISRRRGWEQAVLLPGRIISLPLAGLGYLTDQALGYIEANNLLVRVPFESRSFSERAGFSVKPAHLGSGSGLGGTLAMHSPFLSGTLKNRIRADFSMTLSQYNRTLVAVQGRPARLQYGYDWRPEERFHGVGVATVEDSATTYALQSEYVRGSVRWAWNRDTENAPPRTEVNIWAGPRTSVTRTGRKPSTLSYDERFPALAASTLDHRVEHLIYGGSFSSDWRAGQERWEQGWRVKVQGERYDRPIPLTALRIGRTRGAQFTRLVYETETGFSFMRDPRTVRFMVRVMDQSITSDGHRFLPSDMATLGGREGLAGYPNGRFHDTDLLLTRISYVYPIVRRLELDLHSEWGGVYSNVWADPRLGTLKNSFGVALRGRRREGPLGSFSLDFSRETMQVRLTLGGVE